MLDQVMSTLPAGSKKPGRPFKQRVLRLETCVGKGSPAAIWWLHCKKAETCQEDNGSIQGGDK